MSQQRRQKALDALKNVVHPESGKDIVGSGIVEQIALDDASAEVTLSFPKTRDPFANSIKRQVAEVLSSLFPELGADGISVVVKYAAPKAAAPSPQQHHTMTGEIGSVVAIASGKGGVGKSTVTANLAVVLARMGYRVGVLDTDIYGPSIPRMFGVEGAVPQAAVDAEGHEIIHPVRALDVDLMSIGFFVSPADALVWRGPMATGALRQLIHQTKWGALDFLLVDLPPGTGDVHLTLLHEMDVDGAVIVSTPQGVALADVVRGLRMFRTPGIEVPVLGLIENMAWFTPEELPENRYYIFGRGGAAALAEKEGIPLLGEIPIVQSVMQGGDDGRPGSLTSDAVARHYEHIAAAVVDKLK